MGGMREPSSVGVLTLFIDRLNFGSGYCADKNITIVLVNGTLFYSRSNELITERYVKRSLSNR